MDDISRDPVTVLVNGKWANADVFVIEKDGRRWVVKDFSKRNFFVRNVLCRFPFKREVKALTRLQGIDGIPADFRRLGPWTMAYRFVPGITMCQAKDKAISVGEEYFFALEALVKKLHSSGVVHLDIRNGKNMIITEDQRPMLLDFQSALSLDHMPGWAARFLKGIDLSGVYKFWRRMSPETMGQDREDYMKHAMRFRQFWVFYGYPLKKLLRRWRHVQHGHRKRMTGFEK